MELTELNSTLTDTPKLNHKLNIAIFGDAISTKNGGSASFVELSTSLKKVCNLLIATRFGRFDQFWYQHPNYKEVQKIHKSFPFFIRDKLYRKELFKSYALNFLSLPKLNKVYIKDCALIIDCYGIDPEKVRSYYNTRAKIVRMHNGSVTAFSEYFGNIREKTEERRLIKYLATMSKYDGLIFQSPSQLSTARAILGPKVSMVVLPPTSNENELANIETVKTNYLQPRLLQIASIQPRKNQLGSLQFLSMLRTQGLDAKISFVGPIEDKQYLKKLKLFEEQNRLIGAVSYKGFHTDYYKFYKETDIVTMPSAAEGVSRTLREALYLGKPVITAEIDGTVDLIKDKIVSSMEDEVFQKVNPEDIQRYFDEFIQNGKSYYEQNYSLNNYQRRIIENLQDLL